MSSTVARHAAPRRAARDRASPAVAPAGRHAGPRTEVDLGPVARGGLSNLFGAMLSVLANFGLVLVVARSVSPHDAGVFFTVTSLFLMLETVGRFGADTGLVYFIARWRTLHLKSRVPIGLRAAYIPVVVLCSVIAVAMFSQARTIARLIGDPAGQSVGLLRLLALLLPLTAAYDLTIAATRGFGWMRPNVLIEKILRPAVQVVLVAAVLTFGWDNGLGVAWAMPYVGAFFAAVWMLRSALRSRLAPFLEQTYQDAREVAREFWAFTLPRGVAGVAQILLQRLDIVLVATLRGARDAAVYTAATRFLVVGQFINQAITAPLQPEMASALAEHDTDRAQDLYRASTTWLVLTTWPVFGLATALAPLYLSLFGHSYRDGVPVVVILSLVLLVSSAVGLVDTLIIMAGKTAWNLGTTLLALAVNLSLDIALIPHFGITGAAVGWSASILAANLVPLLLAWAKLGLNPFARSTVAAYVLSGGCFVVLPLGALALSGGRETAAVLACVVGAFGYGVGVWHGRDLFQLSVMLRRKGHAVR
jgi:O-antigen/teichoic acid export membrane protein